MNWVLAAILAVGISQPQAPARDAKLIVTVTDQTNGVLPGATVTITGLDAATKTAAPLVKQTADKGILIVEDLPQGMYSVRIDMDGFNSMLIPDVKLAKGENKRNVTMPLKSMSETVTVTRDRQIVAADRGSVTFGSALTREQIEMLPDDPAELERVLREMAGGDAVIKVDSFEGGRLPDKSQIKAIHISRDQFAAENHFAGGISIDIVTQAGSGPFRMNSSYNLRDSSMDGKNPKIAARAPSRNQGVNFGGSGTVIPQKLSVSFSGGVRRSFQDPLIYGRDAAGNLISRPAGIRAPNNGYNFYGDMTYALTKDQTLRVYYSEFQDESKNAGLGGYSITNERAFSSKSVSRSIRGQEAGPLGRRFVTNTKFALMWDDQQTSSVSDALTQVVNEAFTIGGAQRSGGRTASSFMIQSDLDYVRGKHTVRVGVLAQGGNYRTNDSSNYTGTYVFDSIEAFNAQRPRSFTRRVGDPLIEYFNSQVGVYLQDDIRVSKSLSLSPGIRYEVQTHLRDWKALGPRFGFTWAPFKSGKTSLRASAGIFYDWFSASVYEQSLRVDGFRQREMIIANPTYPNAGSIGTVTATNRYLVDPALQMPRNTRVSAGIDQTITPRARVSATYSYTQLDHSLRGENLNQPVNGVRPDPNFANVVRVLSDGEGRQHNLSMNASWQFSAPSPALQAQRFNIRRGGVSVNYFTAKVRNNYDGAFQTPASGVLANEWGPSGGDIRHRLGFSLNSSALKNLNLGMNVNASTGSPYNITTGLDDNGDLIFNDRPVGYERNAGRGKGQWNSNANVSYNFTFGRPKAGAAPPPPGIMITAMNGGPVSVSTVAPPPSQGRYRVGIFINVFNFLNHANQFGYIGNMRSKDFGTATQVSGVRQFNISVNFGF